MSIVGPRPEVPKYVLFYTSEQKKVFTVKPGITDPASIVFRNEAALLSKQKDPEDYYVHKVMPQKINYYLEYIEKKNFFYDLKLIFRTLIAVFRK